MAEEREEFDAAVKELSAMIGEQHACSPSWSVLSRALGGALDRPIGKCERQLAEIVFDLRAGAKADGPLGVEALSAACRMNVALMCCGSEGAANAAKNTYETWLALAEKSLGARAPEALARLAAHLDERGRGPEAAHALERAIACARTHGLSRDAITNLTRDLGLTLSRAGEHARGVEVLRELSDARTAESAADAIALRSTYASVLLEAGQYDEARTVYEEIAERAKEPHARHIALLSVATALRRGGSESEARAQLASLTSDLQKNNSLATELGVHVVEDHLTMLLSAEDEDAIDVQRMLLDATIAAVGKDHPRVWREEHNLATVLSGVRQDDEAIALFRAVLAKQDHALGPSSPDALRTRRSLVAALYRARKDADAAALDAEIARISPGPAVFEPARVHFRGDA